MLHLSHTHLCSKHFTECNFVNFMAEDKWGSLQSWICSAVHRVTNLEKIPVQISKDEADERLQGKDKKSNMNACSRKGCEKKRPYTNAYGKERKHRPQMSVAKKDQTTNAGGKWKMAALPSQANNWHQMKEIKQLKPPQNPKQLPTCKHKVEKTPKTHTTKSQQCCRLVY